jgi:peptidoglycan/xylan/chitin deacetylase (PgdA/CDA1 family)
MSTRLSLAGLKRSFKSFLTRHEAIVLTYHCTLPPQTPLIPVPHHLDGDLFHDQMRYVASSGFNCVSLQQLAEYIRNQRIPPRTVAITFDDGFYNNLSVAFPILVRYGIPATIFLAAGFIGSTRLNWPEELAILLALATVPRLNLGDRDLAVVSISEKAAAYKQIARHFSTVDADGIEACLASLLGQAALSREDLYRSPLYESLRFMTWDDVHTMAKSKLISFGSHTVNHRRLVHLAADDAEEEIRQSRHIIQQQLGKCDAFAYPHGGRGKDFNDSHLQMAVAAGYDIVVTADSGTVTAASNPQEVPRESVDHGLQLDHFAYLLRGGVSFARPRSSADVVRGIMTGCTH